MSARSQRPASHPTPLPGSPVARSARAAGSRGTAAAHAAAALVLALLACAWPPVCDAAGTEAAAEPPPPATPGAWQRAQRGPINALALIREREAARAADAGGHADPSLPRSGFVAERGGIAWQLEGGGRITVKRQHHTPMLFYRSAF